MSPSQLLAGRWGERAGRSKSRGAGLVLLLLLMGLALLSSSPTRREGAELPGTDGNHRVKMPAFHAGGTIQARILFFPVRLPC